MTKVSAWFHQLSITKLGLLATTCTAPPPPWRHQEEAPVVIALDIPWSKLVGYPSSTTSRPWSPVMLRFKYFRRFRFMFQMFHLDIAKVDLRCCICCNDNICMLQAYVSSVSDVCFKCFIWMLHTLLWLYTHVSSVSYVSNLCCKCFIWMLQK
jgi:hypothetical protein